VADGKCSRQLSEKTLDSYPDTVRLHAANEGAKMETHKEIMSFPRTCLDWLSAWASASRSMGNVSVKVTVS
jgi:hypothetical protein